MTRALWIFTLVCECLTIVMLLITLALLLVGLRAMLEVAAPRRANADVRRSSNDG